MTRTNVVNIDLAQRRGIEIRVITREKIRERGGSALFLPFGGKSFDLQTRISNSKEYGYLLGTFRENFLKYPAGSENSKLRELEIAVEPLDF